MDDVVLEHRLTSVEETLKLGLDAIETRGKGIELQIQGVREEFRRLNGTVARQQAEIAVLQARPVPATASTEEEAQIVNQHRQMWGWFYAWRWFALAIGLALVGLNATDIVRALAR